MGCFQHPIFYALLMFIAGMGIPVMATLNGQLGIKLDSPALAATILFTVGGVVSLGYLFFSGGMPKFPITQPISIIFYLGGLFVVFYILSITWVSPRFGIGNAISLVLLGQLISMAIIDHYGILGSPMNSISIQRIAGLVFMIFGVFLTVRRF
jgi:bacterial/archaeal transporter family-2 protein